MVDVSITSLPKDCHSHALFHSLGGSTLPPGRGLRPAGSGVQALCFPSTGCQILRPGVVLQMEQEPWATRAAVPSLNFAGEK